MKKKYIFLLNFLLINSVFSIENNIKSFFSFNKTDLANLFKTIFIPTACFFSGYFLNNQLKKKEYIKLNFKVTELEKNKNLIQEKFKEYSTISAKQISILNTIVEEKDNKLTSLIENFKEYKLTRDDQSLNLNNRIEELYNENLKITSELEKLKAHKITINNFFNNYNLYMIQNYQNDNKDNGKKAIAEEYTKKFMRNILPGYFDLSKK